MVTISLPDETVDQFNQVYLKRRMKYGKVQKVHIVADALERYFLI